MKIAFEFRFVSRIYFNRRIEVECDGSNRNSANRIFHGTPQHRVKSFWWNLFTTPKVHQIIVNNLVDRTSAFSESYSFAKYFEFANHHERNRILTNFFSISWSERTYRNFLTIANRIAFFPVRFILVRMRFFPMHHRRFTHQIETNRKWEQSIVDAKQLQT